MEVARFTRRTFSYIIDLIISYGVGIGCGIPLFIFTNIPWYFSLLITIAFCYISYLLINNIIMAIFKGRSLGALLLMIKTVNEDGSKVSFKNIFIKNLYLGLLPFTILNAFYMIAVHTEKTIIDRITNTVVIEIASIE